MKFVRYVALSITIALILHHDVTDLAKWLHRKPEALKPIERHYAPSGAKPPCSFVYPGSPSIDCTVLPN